MKTGAFIVFEGIDGSGKTTQANNLNRQLLKQGYSTLLTWEPGGTKLGDTVANWLKTTPIRSPATELFLVSAARSHHIDRLILPALKNGTIVICDRFTPSTIAYQGYGRQMDLHLIDMINLEATRNIAPDLTILIDLPIEVASARNKIKEKDVWEAETELFHQRVRDGYLEQASKQHSHMVKIDGSSTPNVIFEEVITHVDALFTQLNISTSLAQ